ncbi:plastidal glycolate/glycerate translocator 1, chloroplastic-like [Macadamia integrifolia]|uniref:plastidal glycolate/glycerate translocator 1, chloroplastic-like n=1 Tax=Macadamia integrifolia TaxID=60698 RepID=UPI001C4EB9EF|nr:plastidal glycolate/glycerate translocator 1, chloroplastic-like [Macadamia integrifolia]
MDKFLERAFKAAAIKFPSALFGIFCVFSILMIPDSVVPSAATSFMNFFEPANMFIQRWLALFYVPFVVVLPLDVRDIPAASGIKICFVIVGGWLASVFVAGYTAITVRKIVRAEMIAVEPMPKPSPFSKFELWTWTGFFFVSFISALLYPTALGTNARTCLPFLLAATLLGYMVGCGFPSDIKKVFHPIFFCALSADLAAVAFGCLSKSGVDIVLGVNTSLTATVVVLTGLVGANFVQTILDKLHFNDPIAQGIATTSSAHGLGTAALSAKDPEALPFCAITYGLTSIFGSLINLFSSSSQAQPASDSKIKLLLISHNYI